MASVKLEVKLDSDAPETIFRMPGCKDALTKEAKSLASKMNSLGASFVTEEFKRDDGTQVGGKTPRYIAKPAINSKYGSIALVVTGNYAAIKDNHDHNTMLKARG